MNLNKYSIILIALLSTCSTLFGQGRVDTDAVLYKIWWNTEKVDNDTLMKYSLTSTLSQNGKQNIIAYYTKRDTLIKIIKIEGDNKGTKLTAYYFADMMPVFISVKRNNYNYAYSADKKLFAGILSSFRDVVDTSLTQDKSFFPISYKANYYYKNRQLYFSNLTENEKSRNDKPFDNREALLTYVEAEQLFRLYPKATNSIPKN